MLNITFKANSLLGSGSRAFLQPDDGIPRIVIDPGHGGRDPGTPWGNLLEKNLTLDIAKRVRKALVKKPGVRVILTRKGDEFPHGQRGLQKRIQIGNQYRNGVFVSIHLNAGVKGANGMETFHCPEKHPMAQQRLAHWLGCEEGATVVDRRGELLAESVQKHAVAGTGLKDRTVKNDQQFRVIHEVVMPSILVECAFLSDPKDRKKIQDSVFREKVALGIADGIFAYLDETKGNPRSGISINGETAVEDPS
ncbi:MAG: N-acetylmuramoyl-L-alanine amidase [Verrucomicrobiota bacterium]